MSKIEWTERTWNPVRGCRRVSAGCDNCYAILESHRKKDMGWGFDGLTDYVDGRLDWTAVFREAPEHIFNEPLRTRRPTVWFVNSMSDLFGEGVPTETIKRVFAIMERTPQHQYQVLTKRPNRAVRLAPELPWPSNVWLGTSIEEDKHVGRADLLRKIPATVRFISAEPLLGPLPSLDLTGIHWIIVGGESGRSRSLVRPMEVEWARDLRDRAVAAGTAFFFKQWGNWDVSGRWHVAKKDAGRVLDGRTWDELPGGTAVSSTKPVSVAPPTPDLEPIVWGSPEAFKSDLAAEHQREDSAPRHRDQSPRTALREPIWRMLRECGPTPAAELRKMVLEREGLDPASARLVNFHAWALVDLQEAGWVRSFPGFLPSRRGTRSVKFYEATKPRVRIRAA